MSKLVLIGNTNGGQWLQAFYRYYVEGLFDEVTLISSDDEHFDFYQERNVKTFFVGLTPEEEVLSEEERTICRAKKRGEACDAISNIDLLMVHYCVGWRMYCYKRLQPKAKRSMMVYWGSDVFRAPGHEFEMNKSAIQHSTYVNALTGNMKEILLQKYGDEIQSKIFSLDFGANYSHIQYCIKRYDRDVCKKEIGIAPEKIGVMIGYNGRIEQQQDQIIKAIKEIPQNYKDCIVMVFHTGYLTEDSFRIKVEEMAKGAGLQIYVIDRWLDKEEIAKLRCACDIMIHAQTTDALSASVQEYVYAGAVLLNGGWLDYPEFREHGIHYHEFQTFNELPEKLMWIIDHLEEERQYAEHNRRALEEFSDVGVLKSKWRKLLVG